MTLVCHHVPDADRYLHMVGSRVDGKLTFRQRQKKRAAKLKLKAEGKVSDQGVHCYVRLATSMTSIDFLFLRPGVSCSCVDPSKHAPRHTLPPSPNVPNF